LAGKSCKCPLTRWCCWKPLLGRLSRWGPSPSIRRRHRSRLRVQEVQDGDIAWRCPVYSASQPVGFLSFVSLLRAGNTLKLNLPRTATRRPRRALRANGLFCVPIRTSPGAAFLRPLRPLRDGAVFNHATPRPACCQPFAIVSENTQNLGHDVGQHGHILETAAISSAHDGQPRNHRTSSRRGRIGDKDRGKKHRSP
jgi:hypothetical protein